MTVRKSKQVGLSFPYDWSNPNIANDALILAVLRRGIFTDICQICVYFGIDEVERLVSELPDDARNSAWLERMITNIKIGFERARDQQD